MILNKIKSILGPIKQVLNKPPETESADSFLQDVEGVIHVGANNGEEREQYSDFGLRVIWVEPIPEVFMELERNLRPFANQKAYQELVTDVDGKEYQFHISNNNGASSSILELKEHKAIWPAVDYTKSILLNSITLSTLLRRENIDPSDYQALIMDTQGSELLILQGCIDLVENFKYIKIEVPDFESYEGCCQLDDIAKFMTDHGYVELSRNKFAGRETVGNYFDIVYKKEA